MQPRPKLGAWKEEFVEANPSFAWEFGSGGRVPPLSRLVLPGMRRAGRGRIINVSSVAGRLSALGGGAYHASKFALEALADALRPEVEPFGIDVVNVLPGLISTCFEATLLRSIPDTGGQSPYLLLKERLAYRMHAFLKPGA